MPVLIIGPHCSFTPAPDLPAASGLLFNIDQTTAYVHRNRSLPRVAQACIGHAQRCRGSRQVANDHVQQNALSIHACRVRLTSSKNGGQTVVFVDALNDGYLLRAAGKKIAIAYILYREHLRIIFEDQ